MPWTKTTAFLWAKWREREREGDIEEKFKSINKARQQKFDKLLCKTSLSSVAWCVYSCCAVLLLLLLSNQFFVIPICLVTFLRLWFSSPSSSSQQLHQYFPIIFRACVCVSSIYRKIEPLLLCFEWKVELISSEKKCERRGAKGRERERKNVNFCSRDFENVMVMPLWIESSAH